MYGNEEEVGRALRESGLARKDVYITTKYSGTHGLDIETSIHNSLKMVCAPNLPRLSLLMMGIGNVDDDDGLFF
jgi:diketogulonate reductase-like aldo/keto reductase